MKTPMLDRALDQESPRMYSANKNKSRTLRQSEEIKNSIERECLLDGKVNRLQDFQILTACILGAVTVIGVMYENVAVLLVGAFALIPIFCILVYLEKKRKKEIKESYLL